jgi:hypothetical protein
MLQPVRPPLAQASLLAFRDLCGYDHITLSGGKLVRLAPVRRRFFVLAAVVTAVAAFHFRSVARAQDAEADLTPGMLFGPVWVDRAQHVELCSSYLNEGELTQFVHFRNLTTGEVTAPVRLVIPSGGGACAFYSGRGRVVGMARGEGPAADWVSPSNALIGTMSVVDNGRGARVTVLGVAKLWLTGL